MDAYLVQDRLGRVWGTVRFDREPVTTVRGQFQPAPDFDYLRGRFEEHEADLSAGVPDFERLGEQYDWMVSLRPCLVPVDGDPVELACAFVTRDGDDLLLTAVPPS